MPLVRSGLGQAFSDLGLVFVAYVFVALVFVALVFVAYVFVALVFVAFAACTTRDGSG